MKSVHKLMVLIGVIIVGLSLSSTAGQLDTWRGRNPLPQGNSLDGIGNGDALSSFNPGNSLQAINDPQLDKAEFVQKA